MIPAIVDSAGLLAVAGVFGGMTFFAFVYAPLVFIKLGTTIVAAALLGSASAAREVDALAMACIGIVFLLARFVLLPIINRNRDAGQAGDPAAKKRFDALHRMSVIVNMVQLLAVLAVLVRYVAH